MILIYNKSEQSWTVYGIKRLHLSVVKMATTRTSLTLEETIPVNVNISNVTFIGNQKSQL